MQYKRILRFGSVGVINAAISFGILNLSYFGFGQSKIASSIISTACALLFSFVLNRLFVFADRSRRVHDQFIRFVVVTISGSFIVINLVYIIMLKIVAGSEGVLAGFIESATGLHLSPGFIAINLSTAVGAIIAMVWNYNGYRLFVFKGNREGSDGEANNSCKEAI